MSKFPKKSISTEKRAKSIEEAVELALIELNVSREEVQVTVIQEPAKGFLGIGGKEAIVRVSAEVEDGKNVSAKADVQPEVKREKVSGGVYNSELPEENAKKFVSDVLTAMGIEVTVSATRNDDMVNVEVEGENMGVVIGKRGDTLDSLQYLTSLVVNQKSDEYIKVSIDTENYRQKREEALRSLADRLAAKVIRTGKKFALEPMNPYERRIIHSSLQGNDEVTTFSIGQEPYRKVVIAPKNPKPYAKHTGYNKSRRTSSNTARGGYSNNSYAESESGDKETTASASATYKADFKPQQHKAEYKNFEEYLAAHSKD